MPVIDASEPAFSAAAARLQEEVRRAWPGAQQFWSRFLLLSDPIDHPEQPSVAQIDLATRQVSLNRQRIIENDLIECVPALLMHEVGHHVRYPGSLQTSARLRLLERSLIPFDGYSLINVFTDLLINERVGHSHQKQLARVFQSYSWAPEFHQAGLWKSDPVFLFYLSLYEAHWRLEDGALIGPAAAEFAAHFPGYRAQAALLTHNIFGLAPNLYSQFLYFLSFAICYLKPLCDEKPQSLNPTGCGNGDPSPDDWAVAITPSARELEAIRRAIAEGWFDKRQSEHLEESNGVDARIGRLPGAGTEDARQVPEIMAAYYRQQAETYLFRPPAQPRLGEAVVPTTLEEWEPANGSRTIDWLATLSLRGRRFGKAQPLMRTSIAELEGRDAPLWQPRVELYLDVSGSMPDPCLAINAMTLAAQILTLGAVRAGGWVRCLLYSGTPVLHWEWCRSELELSKFLLHYMGGGTNFPFELLDASLGECGRDQPIRVVISDGDFDTNCADAPASGGLLRRAAGLSPHMILLQHGGDGESQKSYREWGVVVVPVADWRDLPRTARDLAWSLFPEGEYPTFQA